METSLNNPYTVAIYLALITIILRLLLDTFQLDNQYIVYVLMFIVLVISYLGVRKVHQQIPQVLPVVFSLKAGMRPGALYALIISVFTFVFYKWINPLFFSTMIEERAAKIKAGAVEAGKSTHEIEAILKGFYEFSEMVFSPVQWASFTLFGMIFLCGFYSFILALVARKFPQMLQ